jgi:hypothetical protein
MLLFKSNLSKSFVVLSLFMLCLLVAGSMTMLKVNASPSVTLNPTSGATGTTVHIFASGFTAYGTINTALFNGTSTPSFQADANGNVNETVEVPMVLSGLYQFVVTDATSGSQTTTQFTVTPGSNIPEFPSIGIGLAVLIAISTLAVLLYIKRVKLTNTFDNQTL